MVEELTSYGICSTCNNRPECRSFQNSIQKNSPVLNCEEFDSFVPGIEIDADENGKKGSYKSLDPIGKMVPKRSIGLCVNCEARKTCMLPFPAGGVLHCEEYI